MKTTFVLKGYDLRAVPCAMRFSMQLIGGMGGIFD
jgi:hypothetical protein